MLRPRPDPVRDIALLARLAALLTDRSAVVAFVWPLAGEPDLRPLMHRLTAIGQRLSLPVIIGPDRPLAFRRWDVATPMEDGPRGTRHPVAHLGDAAMQPDIILVPVIAFDRQRNRLGRGGGFYDRTLGAWRSARAVGFAHATAEIAVVPTEPHDRPLDIIVTDLESF